MHKSSTVQYGGMDRMLAERIKELRKRAGLTQAALAQTVGLSQQAIGKWESVRLYAG